jgi:hypothetical protein
MAHVFIAAAMGKLDRGIALRATAILEDTQWGAWQRD